MVDIGLNGMPFDAKFVDQSSRSARWSPAITSLRCEYRGRKALRRGHPSSAGRRRLARPLALAAPSGAARVRRRGRWRSQAHQQGLGGWVAATGRARGVAGGGSGARWAGSWRRQLDRWRLARRGRRRRQRPGRRGVGASGGPASGRRKRFAYSPAPSAISSTSTRAPPSPATTAASGTAGTRQPVPPRTRQTLAAAACRPLWYANRHALRTRRRRGRRGNGWPASARGDRVGVALIAPQQ